MSDASENRNITATLRPRSWRSQAMYEHYETERQSDLKRSDLCPLCEAETIQEFDHWRIIPNKYPYDAVTHRHDQLVPKRHTDGSDLTEGEHQELLELKWTALNDTYAYIMEALPKEKSIPGHFHLHLMVPKRVD